MAMVFKGGDQRRDQCRRRRLFPAKDDVVDGSPSRVPPNTPGGPLETPATAAEGRERGPARRVLSSASEGDYRRPSSDGELEGREGAAPVASWETLLHRDDDDDKSALWCRRSLLSSLHIF